MRVFFSNADYLHYLDLLGTHADRYETQIWAYCLMPNHVHLIAVPKTEISLARAIGETHRTYAFHTNKRERWSGHLWQERFSSFPMEETHLRAAVRYILLNPVRASLVENATEWPFSSARAHVFAQPDPLIDRRKLAPRVSDWSSLLRKQESRDDPHDQIRRHSRNGRPWGSSAFIDSLKRKLKS